MKNLTKIASILFLWMASQSASGYVWIDCGGIPMFQGDGVQAFGYANTGAQGLTAAEITATSQAFARLSEFSLGNANLGRGVDNNVALGNDQNEIWQDTSHPTAVCNYRFFGFPTCDVVEVDIRIGAPTWYALEDSNHIPYGNSGRSVHGVMVHEGGHCIGLAHTNNLYSIMGEEWTHVDRDSTQTYYGPGEDASDGLIDLHGKRSGGADLYRDIGVTTWRYSRPDGEYSEHKQGRLLNAAGTAELPKTGFQWVGQDEYTIDAGTTFQMEFTSQNIGEMNQEFADVSFRLSTNSILSISDTEIGSFAGYGFHRGVPFEDTWPGLVIPIDTAPGDYWVGVIADPNNAIVETTERNNYAHYPITIPPPDLTVTAPSVSDATPTTGQTITGFATINNVGGAQSAATTLRYYRSTNSTISGADTQVGSDAQGVINPGASIARSEPFIFSATAGGTYWYGACVDTVAGETVTSNNCSTGVQVTVTDVTPPSPNPMTFSVLPQELNTSQIRMTATTASDPAGGIQYFFDFTSSPTAGPGGTDSGWIASSIYTDSGLGPNENYCYRVFARDALLNTTAPSAIDCDYTLANQPVLGSFSSTETSITVNLGADGNPAGTEYWIRNQDGTAWRPWSTSKTWTNTGLTCGTTYSYGAWSQNGDGTLSGAEVNLGSVSTLPCPDSDRDGIPDHSDNCTFEPNPKQCDGDRDGYGNACDADFNQDLIVDSLDISPFRAGFGTTNPVTDLNCDGITDSLDIAPFRRLFGRPPGPSGLVP